MSAFIPQQQDFTAFTGVTDFGIYNNVSMSQDGQYAITCNSGYVLSIYVTTNYGYTWNNMDNYNRFYCSACSDSFNPVYVGGRWLIYKSTNYGSTWQTVFSSEGNDFIFSSMATSSDGSIVIGLAKNIWISTDSGNTWAQPSTMYLNWNTAFLNWKSNAVCCNSTANIIAVTGPNSGVWISTDVGKTWNQKVGNDTTNWTSIDCDATGQYIVVAGANRVLLSTDYGSTFIDKGSGYAWQNLKFGYKNILLGTVRNYGVVCSTDLGTTFGNFKTITTSGNVGSKNNDFVSLAFNRSGVTRIIMVGQNVGYVGVLIYDPTIKRDPTITINGTSVLPGSPYTAIARTKSVNVNVTPTDLREVSSIVGATNLQDDLNTITITISDNTVYTVYVMVLRNCFLEGTKILCQVDNEEKYVPIEEMKEGTLVKTRLNGFVPVHTIGHSKIYNPSHNLRSENRLYKRSKDAYPELIEDLIVTGCHSVLVEGDRITPEILKKTKEIFRDDIWVTDNKLRLLTCLDDLAEPYQEEGVFNIWHFALDHFDIYMNYGVWANGLLMETCSINMMREYSGLELV